VAPVRQGQDRAGHPESTVSKAERLVIAVFVCIVVLAVLYLERAP
jgi:hypothetical protein